MASYIFGTGDNFQVVLLVLVALVPTLIFASLAILWSVSLYYILSHGNLSKMKIPGNEISPLIQTTVSVMRTLKRPKCIKDFIQFICGIAEIHKKKGMFVMWDLVKPLVFLFHPKTIEPVLSSSNENLKKNFIYDFATALAKEGLVTSNGDKWRCRRKLVTPAFHGGILYQFFPIFNNVARLFCQTLAKENENKNWIDIAPLASLCTLDIICETAMGKKLNVQKDRNLPYLKAGHTACQLMLGRVFYPWLWPNFIYSLKSDSQKFNDSIKILDDFTREVVAERHAEMLKLNKEKSTVNNREVTEDANIGRKPVRRLALLDLLLDEHFKDPSFTLEDIAEEVDTFMFAGLDTSSSALSFSLYMLGLHQDVQAKVREEINSVLGDDYYRPIELDDVKHLKYLDRVLKEIRRIYPPVPLIGRELEIDTNIDGHLIPKGTNIFISIYGLHKNPEVFPNPEVFDPDRFLPENAAGRHPFAYLPFSAGPRNCIGLRFAAYEALVVNATIVRFFDIEVRDSRDQWMITQEITLKSDPQLMLKFTPRPELKKFANLDESFNATS